MVRNTRNKADDLESWNSIFGTLQKLGYNLSMQNIHGATALHEAALRANVVAATALVEKYPDLLNITTK